MGCQDETTLVQQVSDLYDQISNLDSLTPSDLVNSLFTKLVLTCMPPSPIDVANLGPTVAAMRAKLIKLCAQAEGLLESHYAAVLASHEHPLDHLHLFPYYSNYLKLTLLEHNLLSHHSPGGPPAAVAFVGSGPLPLTSIVLASRHLPSAVFHNYDVDARANASASALLAAHAGLAERMSFHTADVMAVTSALAAYDVVFLAALVGMDKEEKVRVVEHLAVHMRAGALLMVRSAHGARAFLYPVVEPCDLRGFEVLSVFHPTDDVINSVVVARKRSVEVGSVEQGNGDMMMMPSKCYEVVGFNPLSHGNMIEELAFEE